MSHLPSIAQTYFKRFQNFRENYALKQPPSPLLKVCVVIPAYREVLANTLNSLGQCACSHPTQVEIILVLNQAETETDCLATHQQQFEQWQDAILANGIVVKVQAALDLAPKKAGVGLARKIGMDEALHRFSQINHNGLIVCLDADCTVSENYLEELLSAESQKWKGLSLRYQHPLENLGEAEQAHIIAYEIWLRYYHEALAWSGYKHHFATVGSSMAVRASTYAQVGGMNQRKAGEDFYFLHKVMPQGHFAGLTNLCVYPSARVSTRVPFGTGRAMQEQEHGRKDFSRLYHPAIFQELQSLFTGLGQTTTALKNTPKAWQKFLESHPKIADSFKQLQQRTKNTEQWSANFWHWFDGFTVLKYVHWRSETLETVPYEEALQELFKIQGKPKSCLLQLRQLELERGNLYF
jgi:hypothetical protein